MKAELCPLCGAAMEVEQTGWKCKTYCRQCNRYERIETGESNDIAKYYTPPDQPKATKPTGRE